MPRPISIVVIGRNEEKNIARCLESCLAADWENKEIIYCDSESTDRTLEIARRYPVRVIVHRNIRHNPSIGRNIGLRAARFDYIYFIDADMILEKDFLKTALPILLSRPEIACIVGRRIEARLDNPFIKLIDSSYSERRLSGEVDSPSGGGGLFKRQAVLKAGGYFERFFASEEPMLGLQLRRLGYRIILIDAVMAYHDLDVHTLRQYICFRARQARILANTLLLQEKTDICAYHLAQKHVLEFLAFIAYLVAFGLISSYRPLIVISFGTILAIGLAWEYLRLRRHPARNMYFLHEFILGKPLHIIFEMYYLFRMILSKDHPSMRPDGQIISDSAGSGVIP